MEKVNSSLGLGRTKSEQMVEVVAEMKLPPKGDSTGAVGESSSANVSRRSSRRTISAASPGRVGTAGRSNNTHIRKTSSAQLSWQLDDQLTSGAALSRASSASLGLSFSLTGYIMPPEDIVDPKPFSDDDIRMSLSYDFQQI